MLRQYLQTLTQANIWVYGTPTADLANRGQERRASAYTLPSDTLSFYAAWPAAIAAGSYEIHLRYERSLILEWLNDAIGQLGIYWYRQARDEAIETEDNVLAYNLQASSNWTKITDVQIEVFTGDTIEGGPFAPAGAWNWNAYPYTDQFGNKTWVIQCGLQPPHGRLLRIFGEAYYSDLCSDGDVLALSGQYERPAMSYIFDWVNFRAKEYDSLAGYSTDADKSRQKMYDSLNKAREWLTSMLQPTHTPSPIITPGRGTGLFGSLGSNDPQWFGAINGSSH